MSQAERRAALVQFLEAFLEDLPQEGAKALEAAIERAQARARRTMRHAYVPVEFEVAPDGIEAVELPVRYERRRDGSPRLCAVCRRHPSACVCARA